MEKPLCVLNVAELFVLRLCLSAFRMHGGAVLGTEASAQWTNCVLYKSFVAIRCKSFPWEKIKYLDIFKRQFLP